MLICEHFENPDKSHSLLLLMVVMVMLLIPKWRSWFSIGCRWWLEYAGSGW